MQRTELRSRALVSAGYDPATRELELEFHGGRVYVYRDVPQGVFDFLLRTPSKGSYVNRMIQNRYAFEEVHGDRGESDDMLSALRASLEATRTERD